MQQQWVHCVSVGMHVSCAVGGGLLNRVHNTNSTGTSGGVKKGSRLSGMQKAAASIRNSASIPTYSATNTTITINTTTSTTSTTTSTTTNTTESGTGDAILVFLSGIQSIEKVNKALRQRGVLHGLKAQVHVFIVLCALQCVVCARVV